MQPFRRKKIERLKSDIFNVIIVAIQNSVMHVISENLFFFNKVSVTKIFSESNLYNLEMNVLEEDAID